jgi:DNA invertase Pin-like site-specific DNA recombinase
MASDPGGGPGLGAGGDLLSAWVERTGPRPAERDRAGLRFAFYGRVSTEDWQDPVTSRARQRGQAAALVSGHGTIVAEYFDSGESRTLAWARRPQAAAMVGALADPDRGWDAIVIGEYERAFYGSQYASMAPLFAHYGIQLWTPEAGGPVGTGEDHEQLMLALGLQSKREIARTRIRVRTAMAAQTREQGRCLGGRPPYGYRLADAVPGETTLARTTGASSRARNLTYGRRAAFTLLQARRKPTASAMETVPITTIAPARDAWRKGMGPRRRQRPRAGRQLCLSARMRRRCRRPGPRLARTPGHRALPGGQPWMR